MADDTKLGRAYPGRPPNRLMLGICAVLGFAGIVTLLLGNIIGSIVVPGHDWVADTISDLAAGRYEIIQDVALYGYAAGLLGIGLGAAHIHPGGHRWTLGVFALACLAAIVVVVGARNEYGDSDQEGVVIHIYLVYGLGILFAAAMISMAQDLDKYRRGMAKFSYTCAALWGVGAIIFFMLPTGYDGAWERGLGLVTMVWLGAVAATMWREVS